MRKTGLLSMVLVLVAVVFLSGCTNTNTGKSTAFVGGIEGLRLSFMTGSPPDAIYDGGQYGFAVVVRMENVGEDTVLPGEGYVEINGLDPGTYGITEFYETFPHEIRGAVKSPDGNVLNGMSDSIDFGDLRYIPVIQGPIDQTVWADVCYKYTTKATTQLCIKDGAYYDDKICSIEGEKYPQNSGAPIHVTSLSESFAGSGKIGLSLRISHVGRGDAFFDDRTVDCEDVEYNQEKGKIHVKILPVRVGGNTVTPSCTGLTTTGTATNEGYVRLYSSGSGKEETTLYCTLDVGEVRNVFEVPMDIELTYKYLQHLEKTMSIRHAYTG